MRNKNGKVVNVTDQEAGYDSIKIQTNYNSDDMMLELVQNNTNDQTELLQVMKSEPIEIPEPSMVIQQCSTGLLQHSEQLLGKTLPHQVKALNNDNVLRPNFKQLSPWISSSSQPMEGNLGSAEQFQQDSGTFSQLLSVKQEYEDEYIDDTTTQSNQDRRAAPENYVGLHPPDVVVEKSGSYEQNLSGRNPKKFNNKDKAGDKYKKFTYKTNHINYGRNPSNSLSTEEESHVMTTNHKEVNIIKESYRESDRMKRIKEKNNYMNTQIEKGKKFDQSYGEVSVNQESTGALQTFSDVIEERTMNLTSNNSKIQEDKAYPTYNDSKQLLWKSFKSMDHYGNHQISDKGPVKTYTCKKCGKYYFKQADLKRHKNTHTSLQSYSCSFCLKVFIFYNHFVSHMKGHFSGCFDQDNATSVKALVKSSNQMDNTGTDTLVQQESSNQTDSLHNDKIELQKLNGNIDSPDTLEIEQQVLSHQNGSLVTNTSEQESSNQMVNPDTDIMEQPTETKTTKQVKSEKTDIQLHPKIHPCSICGRSFSLRKDLRRHIDSHLGIKRFTCQICSKKFSRSHNLKRHMTLHAKSAGNHLCNFCGEKFSEKTLYLQHLLSCRSSQGNRMQDERNSDNTVHQADIEKSKFGADELFKCNICEKVLCHKSSLRYHLLNHTQDKRYKCTQCDKSYVHKKDLNTHLKSHADVKPHLCLVCGKSYTRSNDLREHLYKHVKNDQVEKVNISDISAKQIDKMLGNTRGPFECTVCGMTLASKKTFQDHLFRHTGERKHKCPKCNKAYVFRKDLNQHQKTHSKMQEINKCATNSENQYICPICGRSFVSSFILELHKKLHDKNVNSASKLKVNIGSKLQFECNKCGQNFSQILDLKRHKLTHPKLMTLKCDLCPRKFMFYKHFIHHVESHESNRPHGDHGEKRKREHKCPTCNKIYVRPIDLKRHLISHMAVKPYACKLCSKTFTRAHGVKRHMSEVHRNTDDQRSFPCTKCKKVFQTSQRLGYHFRRHALAENPQYQCGNCLHKFSTNSHLQRHILDKVCTKMGTERTCGECGRYMRLGEEVHKKICPKGQFKCQDCGKIISIYENFLNHKKLHLEQRDFKCDLCDRSYVSKYNLDWHKKNCHENEKVTCEICHKVIQNKNNLKRHIYFVHSEERNCMCHVCGKSFKDVKDVKIHMRIHTGEKPFSCEICDKSFSTSSGRTRHGLVHTGIRSHVCEICGKLFKTPNNLKQHMKTHNKEKIYDCDWCDKSFISKRNLNKHVTKLHTVMSFFS